jgi:maltooligosyltrehalose trehalohydrolase
VRTLSVWAPNASRVNAVVTAAGRHARYPMTQQVGGWWHVELDIEPGTDYGFALDGDDPLPDPRSAWQPAGVHGLSRLVDHESFQWRAAGWRGRPIAGSVGYELHIGTFTETRTFDAAIERLDHLVELGIDFVELMPVAAFPGNNGWGYDGVFPFAVQDSYGGPDGLKRFVDGCHARGLAVVLDVVYNHLGPDGNALTRYGPYFTDQYATPWGSAINYAGPDSDEVRRYVLDNALMWLRDYRFDGLRLDAVHAIIDTSATHLLEELSDEVEALSRELSRPLTLVAESDLNDPRIISPREIGGYGIDAQWSDDFHHALHAALTGETFGYYEDFGSLADVAAALTRGFVYVGQHSKHRHRRHGRRLPPACSADQLFGYSQNHDQVGNRARGERLAALVSPGLLKVGAALVLTSPFTPMLFMGEEWAASTPWQYFTEHQDRELGEAVRRGRRSEFASFGWEPAQVPDPQDPQTSQRSTLRWDELSLAPHAEILQWYRDLIRLRRDRADLRDGRFNTTSVEVDDEHGVIVVMRGETVVVANVSPGAQSAKVAASSVLASSDPSIADGDGYINLPGESVAVLAV